MAGWPHGHAATLPFRQAIALKPELPEKLKRSNDLRAAAGPSN